MKITLKLISIIVFGVFALATFVPKGETQTKVETAGQHYKSIKVLNDMPADQLGKVMNMISASLGVDCKFCHASNDADFEKEGFEHKDTARKMMTMMFDLNKAHFNGRPEINCNTCHHGISHPQPSFPLTVAAHAEERPKQPEKKPTMDEILAKYETALGGKVKLAKVTSRYIKAQRDLRTACLRVASRVVRALCFCRHRTPPPSQRGWFSSHQGPPSAQSRRWQFA